MKITFLSPHIGIGGGIKIIFEYANRLMDLGHDVTVVSIIPKSMRGKTSKETSYAAFEPGKKNTNPVKWFDLRTKLILAHDFHPRYIPDGDVVVASAWQTAYDVNGYPPQKGKKLYFIQSYETWDGPEDLVDGTWTLPLRKIVIASWLKDLAENKFHQKVSEVITNPIDSSEFYCKTKQWNQPRKIGMLYHKGKWKGVKDAKTAFSLAKKVHPGIKLVMFGAKPDPEWTDIEYEYYHRPSNEALRELYCSCDIWLSGSLVDGSALTPAEAMACRCALVATDIGGVRDYAINNKTALLSPKGNPDALAMKLIYLIENELELERISDAGYNIIKQFTWEKAVKIFEQELISGAHKQEH
ncbi:glycosyltransferase family 4 protein [Thermodesulfobacteriota bacterium]